MLTAIRRVIVVFKTHLDIGFTASARSVLRTYRTAFIPKALATARKLREGGGPERFIWTTGSWLIQDYLETSAPAGRRAMEAAIAAGDIAWHALPFTWHSELLDVPLTEAGLAIASRLDARFGRKTIAGKMTDVPGHTRGLIGPLARSGVRFVHFGVNHATPVPQVPPLFRWRDAAGQEVAVAYSGDYGEPVTFPGLPVVLHFAHTYDNKGPQTPDEIRALFARLRTEYPGATVAAGTMDDFARELGAVWSRLPVVTAEIADTWIHGVGSDPWKIARYRELTDLHRRALAADPALSRNRSFQKFAESLLLVAEHTWGRDMKTVHPPSRRHPEWRIITPGRWRTADFRRDRAAGVFADKEFSWREQRAYLNQAVAALRGTPLAREARRTLTACTARKPVTSGLARFSGLRGTLAGHAVAFDPRTGALIRWTTPDGRTLAGRSHALGHFHYQIFSPADVERWYEIYPVNKEVTGSWARPDFTKHGYEKLRGIRARRWSGRVTGAWVDSDEDRGRVVLRLVPPAIAHRKFGCPREVFVSWTFAADPAAPTTVTLQWFGKSACRIPEAAWFSFTPRLSRTSAWRLLKTGEAIDPRDVVRRGNRRLHGVETVVHPNLTIRPHHTPLVRLGEPTLYDFRQDRPDLRDGLHFNLVNNTWATNFVQWTDDDVKFKFTLTAGLQGGDRNPHPTI
jgi:hypothetical protein